jgi:hypothetical protein
MFELTLGRPIVAWIIEEAVSHDRGLPIGDRKK